MNAVAQPIQLIASIPEDSEITRTVANKIYRFVFDFGNAQCTTIPADFEAALADFEAGRVIDLDTALNDSSPSLQV